jgi:hypothetical protein
MANRIYFANQQVAFRRDGGAIYTAAHGVQSVAVTTTFNLEQAFELGQLSIYENIEGVPDVEVTATKVLDGYPLLYHLATQTNQSPAHAPTLAGRSNAKCVVALGVWPDTDDFASLTPSTQMEASGMFASSVSYNFPLEDNFTEDITLVGNDKGWNNIVDATAIGCTTPPWTMQVASGAFDGSDVPKASGTNDIGGAVTADQFGGVNRRENLAFNSADAVDAGGVDYTLLPTQIPGVSASGWMSPKAAGNEAHLQSITVSTDLGREELFELGTRQPYARVVTFPVEVTCDVEVLSLSGDLINAFADGCQTSTDPCTGIVDNLSNEKIRIATCEGTRIYLGTKNKLASVNYGGGDAGGGNVTITFSYTTFNDFTVLHPQDPDASGTGWWSERATQGYLT